MTSSRIQPADWIVLDPSIELIEPAPRQRMVWSTDPTPLRRGWLIVNHALQVAGLIPPGQGLRELVDELREPTDAGELIWGALTREVTGVLHCCGGEHIDRIGLDDLLCIEDQKAALVQNTRQFLAGATGAPRVATRFVAVFEDR